MSDPNRLNGRSPLEKERLRAMLHDDLESPEEAEALLSTVQRLRHWSAPDVSAEDHQRLVQTLLPVLPAAAWWFGQ